MTTPAFNLFAALGWRERRPPRGLVFVAHPDDETIGLGGHLDLFDRILIVHATDGSPRNLEDARAHGFATAEAYAQARRRELTSALAFAGLGPEATLALNFADQEAVRNLVPLTRAFAAVLADQPADYVFTHAYEGGHPDHDAVALAAHAALAVARASGGPSPRLIEMPFYHSERREFVRQRFSGHSPASINLALTPERWLRKRAMIACFATQSATLAPFQLDEEIFREAPEYDFSRPPNNGDVLYEMFDWGCRPAEFVSAAQTALKTLGLSA